MVRVVRRGNGGRRREHVLKARFTGVAAVVVLWVSIAVALSITSLPLTGSQPLSHLSGQPGSDLWFSGGLALAACLFVAFHGYLRVRFRLSDSFSVFMILGMAAQFVAAVVPIGGDDVRSTVHQVSAMVLGASIPLFLWRFAVDQPRGNWRRLCFALVAVDVAACAVGIILSTRGAVPISQIIQAAAFHLWVVVVSWKPQLDLEDVPALVRPGGVVDLPSATP